MKFAKIAAAVGRFARQAGRAILLNAVVFVAGQLLKHRFTDWFDKHDPATTTPAAPHTGTDVVRKESA